MKSSKFNIVIELMLTFDLPMEKSLSNISQSQHIMYSLNKIICLLTVYYLLFDLSAVAQSRVKTDKEIIVGAAQIEVYLPLLEKKGVAIVANQTTMVNGVHLVDTLLSLGVNIVLVFAPEHGFRGTADAGEHVSDQKDSKTGLPIVSLYGSHKKPKPHDFKGVDIVVFDIQDVGVRFYTYISTMAYVMEACAENVKDFLVLDRPNPNGFYVDGPILEKKQKSFVGMHEVPVVHGMTVAEYAKMVNEEGWLANGVKCALDYVTCEGYTHNDYYQLPIKPSPNLPNMSAIYLYPSLGFFEGTVVSVGRGTEAPFQQIGHPKYVDFEHNFIPIAMTGAKYPKLKGEKCKGFDLREFGDKHMVDQKKLYLHWVLNMYNNYPEKEEFFLENNFFNLLSGNMTLMQQVKDGITEAEIRSSWEPELTLFKAKRKKYLLYTDFD